MTSPLAYSIAPLVHQASAIEAAPLAPAVKKTALRRLYESALAQDARAALTGPTGQSVLATALAGAEGGGIGYALGLLASSKHGKYAGIATVAAAVAGLGGSLIPGNPIPEHFRNVGVAATAILAYRKGEAKGREDGAVPAAHGAPDDPADEIVKIAKRIGIE